ncbi:hypothetical protein CDIK_2027 [Cucumispora dikerogammari]|nr:hypothetical protein CDIK_2027 [Cucumispora dikerogammari]
MDDRKKFMFILFLMLVILFTILYTIIWGHNYQVYIEPTATHSHLNFNTLLKESEKQEKTLSSATDIPNKDLHALNEMLNGLMKTTRKGQSFLILILQKF